MIQNILLIGASTGGPSHIQKIVTAIDNLDKSVLIIAQHIGEEHINPFVNQLNGITAFRVEAAKEDKELLEKHIYVVSGLSSIDYHHNKLLLKYEENKDGFNPNINHLFNSVAAFCKDFRVISVILTGIGDDGAQGSYSIAKQGGSCIAESEESAIVYGMPLRTLELNPIVKVAHLDVIAKKLMDFIQ